MVTITKPSESETGTRAAISNHKFLWLDTHEQVLKEFGKVRLFEKESIKNKFLVAAGASGAYTRGVSNARSNPQGIYSPEQAGNKASRDYIRNNKPKLLDIRADGLVVTDNRLIFVAKDGSRAYEFIRDIDFAKRYFEYLKYLEDTRNEAAHSKHKGSVKPIVGGAVGESGSMVIFLNSAEKTTGLMGGHQLKVELQCFSPMGLGILEQMKGKAANAGFLGKASTFMLEKLNAASMLRKKTLYMKFSEGAHKIDELLNVIGNRDEAMIAYSTNKELLRKDYLHNLRQEN